MRNAPEDSLAELIAGLVETSFDDEASIMSALRRAKRAAHLLIALADIGGVWGVVEATAALTRFADAAVAAALEFCVRSAAREGRLRLIPV